MRLFSSLRGRLFAGIITIGLLPLVGLSLLLVAATQVAFRAVMLEHARTIGESANVLAAERAQRLLSNAQVVATEPAVRNALLQHDDEGLLTLLQARQAALGGPTLTVADQNGDVRARAYAPGQFGQVTTKGSQRALRGEALASVEEGLVRGLAIRGFAPIQMDGRVIGVVVVTQNVDQEFIAALRQTVGVETFVVLRDGTAAGAALDPAVARVIAAGGQTFSGYGSVGGKPKALFARALRDPDGQVVGFLGSAQPLGSLDTLLDAFYRTAAMGGLVALLSAVALAWLLSRWLIRPVERLAAAARTVQAMPAGAVGAIPLLATGDEIGELSRALRAMVAALTEKTEAVEALNHHLAIQYAVTRVLAGAESLDEAAPELLRTIGERLGWTMGALWLAHERPVSTEREGPRPIQSDGAEGVMQCAAYWHAPGSDRAAFVAATRSHIVVPGVGLLGRVYTGGQAVWVPDVLADDNFPRAPTAAQAGLHAAVGFPIRRGDHLLGVLEFFSGAIRAPDAALLATMTAAAGQIAQFVERTRGRAERARLARSAARERATLAAVTASMSDGLVVFGPDRRVQYANQRAEQLVGFESTRLQGLDPAAVFQDLQTRLADADRAQAHWRRAERAIAMQGKAETFEIHVTAPVPRDVQVEMFHADAEPALEDEAPGVPASGMWRMAVLLRDVSAERTLVRAKDELVSVVSHELRTPLTALVGFAELLLEREFAAPQRRQYLETMLREGHRLTALINDFLDVQRIESGSQRLRPAPTALPPLLDRAATTLGDDPSRPITVEAPPDLPPVWADPNAILQVLTNLLGNARKYSPTGGAIQVIARASGGEVAVSVVDHGLGLPPEALPHLFEKFYRVDNSDRRGISGTGLGLAICRGLVAAHGGRIWAESGGSGQGSTFTFSLPLAESTAASPGPGTPTEVRPAARDLPGLVA